MRIIAGLYKGFPLQSFQGKKIRPTPSKVREAVFDILGFKVIESDFLDLFAGTGAVGIEALSRGAKRVTFVEINGHAIELIKSNLMKINQNDFSNIINNNYMRSLKVLNFQQKKFDIIFLDPPYDKNITQKTLYEIDKNYILKRNSIIIAQHQINENIQGNFQNLSCLKEKRYGKSKITLFSCKE